MKQNPHSPNAPLNIACGLTAVLMALVLEYKPTFLFDPAFRSSLVPIANITLWDVVFSYLAIFIYLGGLVALVVLASNLSFKVRVTALCYFVGWAFGWCWHLIRFWIRWGHW